MFQIRSSRNDPPSPRWSAIVERPRRQGRGSRVVALGLSAALSIGLSAPVAWSAATSGHPIAIDGTVFSVDDQAPIDRARVHLGNPRSGEMVTSEATGKDGAFRMDGLTPGTWRVAVESPEGLFLVAAPLILAEDEEGPRTLQLMVTRAEGTRSAASKLRLADGRASIWNNPTTAALIVVGAAIVAGLLIDAATDDEDTVSPSSPGRAISRPR